MGTKKPRVSKARPGTPPAPRRVQNLAARPPTPPAPRRVQNLAARPPMFDDTNDEQLVDHSGVFRVTSQIAQAQTGHGDDASPRFASESLVMAAQRDEGTIDDTVEEQSLVDEAALAVKRQRLITLAARATRSPPRKR